MSFFKITIYLLRNPEKNINISTQNITQLFSTLTKWEILISWAPNRDIRMISEGSCDNEDWSNDAENSAVLSQE